MFIFREQRENMLWKKALIVVAAILTINVILALIILPLNVQIDDMLSKATAADNTSSVLYQKSKDDKTVKIIETPAETVLNSLISKLPPVDGFTMQGKVNEQVVSSSLDERCATPTATISPVYGRSVSYSASDKLAGVSMQVNAYPAGQGAKYTEELLGRVAKCTNVKVFNHNLGYATESFSIDDNGVTDGVGGEGRTTIFRVGDVVGVVSVRSVDKTLAETLSKTWYTNWGTILTTEVCPQQLSTTVDASRSVFDANYNNGWLHRETVTLDDARSLVSSIIMQEKLPQTSFFLPATETQTLLPTQPLNTSPLLEVVKYPDSLKPVFPENKPTVPAVPKFPEEPKTFTTEPVITNDEVGPGCGWKFTGQVAPVSDSSKKKTNEITDVRIAAADKLMVSRSSLWSSRFQYGKDYKEYAAYAEIYNNWVKAANKAISKAWWDAYDQSLVAYQDSTIAYIEAYAKWKIANPTCIAPENTIPIVNPTPVPSTTPVQTPTTTLAPGCPTPPKAPIRPVEPTIARPELLP